MSDTVIVVPCYNEADRLDVDAFRRFVGSEAGCEILFVDDGSTDQTAARLESLRVASPGRIDVLRLSPNRGKAEAVRRGVITGFDRGARFVGFWDADLATPLEAVPQFLNVMELRADIDLVMGARVALLGRHIERRASRHYFGRAFATAVSLVLGLRVYDTQCGAKLLRVTPATRAAFDTPFRTRWLFDVELIARLTGRRGGEGAHRILELPLWDWQDRPGSKLRAWDFVVAPLELALIGWRELRGRHRRSATAARREGA